MKKIKIEKESVLDSLNIYKLIQENLGNSIGKDYPEFASAVKNGKKFWAAEYIIEGSNFEKELKDTIKKGNFSKIKGASISLEGNSSMTLDSASKIVEKVTSVLPANCEIIWGAKFNNDKLKDKAILQLVLVE
jgi:cell division GTPase FtsZ